MGFPKHRHVIAWRIFDNHSISGHHIPSQRRLGAGNLQDVRGAKEHNFSGIRLPHARAQLIGAEFSEALLQRTRKRKTEVPLQPAKRGAASDIQGLAHKVNVLDEKIGDLAELLRPGGQPAGLPPAGR